MYNRKKVRASFYFAGITILFILLTATTALCKTFYEDADGDGYGNPAVSVQAAVTPPDGYVEDDSDCNDDDAAIHPGAEEIPNNAVDENCDGVAFMDADLDGVADDVDNCPAVSNTDQADGDSDGIGDVCDGCTDVDKDGYCAETDDCNDYDASVNPGATEICNGIDDDCDGQVDEDVQSTFYLDSDSDGFGNPTVSAQACEAPVGYVTDATDCNDTNASVNPGATEICNGIDDDCNGQVDEGVQSTFYMDSDGDGFGDPTVTTQACSAPEGYVADNTDCNDNNALVNPGVEEIVHNGIEDDCNPATPDSGLGPEAVDDQYTVNEDEVLSVPAPGVLGNDSDPDGDPLNAVLDDQPLHGEVELYVDGHFTYTPVTDYNGEDSFTYHANDGVFDSATAMVVLNITPVNDAPVAKANGDMGGVAIDETIQLDGSGSYDPDGDPLTYTWTMFNQPAGSSAMIDDPSAVQTYFTVDQYGTYKVQLVVNDGNLDSDIASVIITTIADDPPVSVIGPVQDAAINYPVCPDGSESYDPNGDALTYQWTLTIPAGSTAQLNDANAVTPCFTPDVAGAYRLVLTVSDGLLNGVSEEVTVNVDAPNIRPVAVIGDIPAGQTVGTPVCLNGSGSHDVNGDALSYDWSMSNRPAASSAVLDTPTVVDPCFTPDVAGDYQVQLIVNDGIEDSLADTVLITVSQQWVVVPRATSCDEITAAGLLCETVEECSDTVPTGVVIGQTPVAGTLVQPGGIVTLTISSGACPLCGSDGDCDADYDADGFTENQGDCNDDDGTIYPGAPEICGDGIDQNCNGEELVCSSFSFTTKDGEIVTVTVSNGTVTVTDSNVDTPDYVTFIYRPIDIVISNTSIGETIEITIEFPDSIPGDAEVLKTLNGFWQNINAECSFNAQRNILTFQVLGGESGDSDNIADVRTLEAMPTTVTVGIGKEMPQSNCFIDTIFR